MSFFGRTFVVLALFAGAVHVFRRDIARVVGVLKKPTENFIREVKHEIDTGNKPAGALASKAAGSGASASAEGAAKAAAAADAANQVTGGGGGGGAGAAPAAVPPPTQQQQQLK